MAQTKTILITGGAGFIGSHLALTLKKINPQNEIISLDNFSRNGSRLNIPKLEAARVRVLEEDVRNREAILSLKNINLIIDCAAEPSVMAGRDEKVLEIVDINLNGTMNSLELARQQKADFIFLSTSRVYPIETIDDLKVEETETRFNLKPDQKITGVSKNGINEDFPLQPEKNRTLYGATKLAAEFLIREYATNFGIKTVINRCGLISGAGQFGKSDQGVVALWVASHYFGKPLSYIGYGGTGKQTRDILHVEDLSEAIDWQIRNLEKSNGQIFNLGGGLKNSLSLREMTNICQEITGRKVSISPVKDGRAGDIKIYITDYSKFKTLSGWEPKRTAKKTVTDLFKWISENKNELEKVLT
ncbi:MAG TPA: NAD-dependent epimerase/dehydratase family protein [Candidatus Paceibacterota bacterium]|nr:NAD-dependent epimerase/dehydratase family protein [Candidatus Paceibacterota bacterium]